MTVRSFLVYTLLGLAAIGSWYLARNKDVDTPQQRSFDDGHLAYYLKSARIFGTAADGSMLYEIRAKHAVQSEAAAANGIEAIEFTDINIRYSPDTDVPWIVDADTAVVQQGMQKVMLSGNVLARSEEGFSGNDTEIRTPYLELDPEQFIAQTDEKVQIRIGERSLSATGMRASLSDNRVQLRSNVSGKFVP